MNLDLPWLACFFCGVDSRALLYFFLVLVISLVLASVAFLVWAISKGDFKNIESPKYDMFIDPEAGGSDETIPLPPLARRAQKTYEH
jgi:nitrogen fixation-related uncharacterized protein